VPSWLEAQGFTPGYAWAKFERGLEQPSRGATELRVAEAQGGAEAEAFADVFVRAYGTPEIFREWVARLPGRPGWHCFLAYAGDEPAATGALYVEDGVGWLGAAGTLPEHRRKGAQNAILSARIEAAAEAGCEVLVTETGGVEEGRPSNSYRNILRAGFEFLYVRPNYLSSPDADTSGTTE
jgi:GNAT superfamily N-acetyltransferase